MPIPAPDLYETPISEADPCGEALDYDLDFLELEMAARGKPGQELGTAVLPPEPPDWAEVDRLGGALTARSKDLRVAILVARAALALDGLGAFARAVEGLAVYVDRFWPGLHPRPDEEDGDDETVRFGALGALCDPDGIPADLRDLPLTRSRVFPPVSVRIWLGTQRAPAEGEPAVDAGAVQGSFRETPPDVLAAFSADLGLLLSAVARIEASLKARFGSAHGIAFAGLVEILGQMLRAVDGNRPAPEVPAAPAPAEAAPAPTVPAPGGEIRGRDDVVRTIDRICAWYAANEPASPVPPLLERAKRLVSKDFMTLLLELAPEGAAQFRALTGLKADAPQQTH